jgi:hypothetical protein
MHTSSGIEALQAARVARDSAKRQRHRDAELKAFIDGATMVLTGLLMATVYCLLSHQISI